jgi:3-phosphoshikimate 1-carboxyvinyltransferase
MKNNIILTKASRSVKGTVHLTGSKSECNRALIIEALSQGKVKVQNMSDAADTAVLKNVLGEKSEVGSRKSEVGRRKAEGGGRKAESQKLEMVLSIF